MKLKHSRASGIRMSPGTLLIKVNSCDSKRIFCLTPASNLFFVIDRAGAVTVCLNFYCFMLLNQLDSLSDSLVDRVCRLYWYHCPVSGNIALQWQYHFRSGFVYWRSNENDHNDQWSRLLLRILEVQVTEIQSGISCSVSYCQLHS